MPAFLEKAAVAGVQRFESRERSQGIGDPPQVSLTDGDQVEDVPIFRILGEQPLRGRQSLGKLPLLQQRAGVCDFRLDAGRRGI